VQTVWFVLHGYGQRAEEFLEMFKSVFDENILFVAPEALSRFYRRNRDDYIGASWMTSAERESEIEDYVAYLDSVYDHVFEAQHGQPVRFGVLGFSQGSSTASRWVFSRAVNPDRLVLWGGTPALELRSPDFQKKLEDCQVDWVTGSEDRFTPPSKFDELLPQMDSSTNPIRVTVFEGKHELESHTLSEIIQRWNDQF
jgi:predicted esterase